MEAPCGRMRLPNLAVHLQYDITDIWLPLGLSHDKNQLIGGKDGPSSCRQGIAQIFVNTIVS